MAFFPPPPPSLQVGGSGGWLDADSIIIKFPLASWSEGPSVGGVPHAMGVPIIALIVGSARLAFAVVDPYLLFPDPVVNIQDTKNSSVNLTLSDFTTVAQQNRLAYNAIMPMLKANTTLSEYNILLRGLEAARAKSEAGSPSPPPPANSSEGVGSEIPWDSTLQGSTPVFIIFNF